MIELIIAGDLSPQKRVAKLIDGGENEKIFGEVQPIITSADYSIVNLEAPIVNGHGKPIEKAGPNLKCSKNVIQSLQYCDFDCVTLANNHFYDYGEEGVLTTFNELKDGGIDYVGAGINLNDASNTLFKTIKGKTFAFVNCCEHEFSIASDETAGSNPLNPIQQYYKIQEAKAKADYIIVIVHGGIEHYQLPTPRMTETYRFFIDAGADAVVNHHQHCYSGYEYYKNRPVVYGLGNFCFDWNGKRNVSWNEGYLLKMQIEDCSISLEAIPYKQCDEEPTIILMKDKMKTQFNDNITSLNNIIQSVDLLSENYEKHVKEKANLGVFTPYSNRYLRALCNRGFLPSFLSTKKILLILNAIKCESLQDKIIRLLEMKHQKK
jgi:poly-gamma-glutamate synthesis protein (capsule biosynthesis protein)